MKAIIARTAILRNIAKTRTGSPFRERIIHEPGGKYGVVQGKDVGSDGTLTLDGITRLTKIPGRGEPETLQPGEVVLQTRGSSYRAAVVPQSDIPLVAAGSLFILATTPSQITSAYLVFILNLPSTQATLRQLATGSTILNLRRSVVEQLEVPLPSLADQHRLVKLGDLVRQQSELAERLNQLRLQELHALTLECAKKAGGVGTPPASNQPERRRKRPQALS